MRRWILSGCDRTPYRFCKAAADNAVGVDTDDGTMLCVLQPTTLFAAALVPGMLLMNQSRYISTWSSTQPGSRPARRCVSRILVRPMIPNWNMTEKSDIEPDVTTKME